MTREPDEERISHRLKTKVMKNIKRKVVKINLFLFTHEKDLFMSFKISSC